MEEYKVEINHAVNAGEFDIYLQKYEDGVLVDADNFIKTYKSEHWAVKFAEKLADEYEGEVVRTEVAD